MDCVPSGAVSQNRPFSSKLLFAIVFCCSNRKDQSRHWILFIDWFIYTSTNCRILSCICNIYKPVTSMLCACVCYRFDTDDLSSILLPRRAKEEFWFSPSTSSARWSQQTFKWPALGSPFVELVLGEPNLLSQRCGLSLCSRDLGKAVGQGQEGSVWFKSLWLSASGGRILSIWLPAAGWSSPLYWMWGDTFPQVWTSEVSLPC